MSSPFQTKHGAICAMLEKLSRPRSGRPAFISEVQASSLKRFAEDLEIAHIDWSKDTGARDRIVDLETVLSDTTYRFVTVLFGEGWGLEQTEKECGLPARSGKIVLLIAAEHLVPYYADE